MLDNAQWLSRLGFVEALRDIGKHFSVNMMIQKESVRSRLTERDHGISYTEFSYMILQAYDFLELRRRHGVEAQVGGSDQWGNIVAGVDLVRRVMQEEVFGLTAPLVTKADGGKFGKTEAGAVWLTPERTSPYAMHQFWLNTDDADVGRFLRVFTLLPRQEVERLELAHGADPGAREAQRALARHVTALVHGDEEAKKAEAAAGALFSGDVRALDERTLGQAFEAAPTSEHARSALAGAGADLVEVLTQTTLVKSKREAREFLAAGAVSVNGAPAGAARRLTADDLLHGRTILLRRGKKNWHVTRWV
jgi:tyrosyl-tRNA synthetase